MKLGGETKVIGHLDFFLGMTVFIHRDNLIKHGAPFNETHFISAVTNFNKIVVIFTKSHKKPD